MQVASGTGDKDNGSRYLRGGGYTEQTLAHSKGQHQLRSSKRAHAYCSSVRTAEVTRTHQTENIYT